MGGPCGLGADDPNRQEWKETSRPALQRLADKSKNRTCAAPPALRAAGHSRQRAAGCAIAQLSASGWRHNLHPNIVIGVVAPSLANGPLDRDAGELRCGPPTGACVYKQNPHLYYMRGD